MTEWEESEVLQLAKKGEHLTPLEVQFCTHMLDKEPQRYREIYRQAKAEQKADASNVDGDRQ